ncbi:MAG: PQQ-binding-like beta-propeller repeat protein [Bacteroidales bacterium]
MKNRVKKKMLLAAAFITLSTILTAQTAEFRGPGRTGVFNETGLLKSWPATGPKLLWEATGLGTGYSSVTPTADAIYITGRKGDNDVITSYTHEGRKNWELVYGKAWNRTYPESRSIPTYVDGYLYLVSGQGDIVCVSSKGEKLWSNNHFQKYNASAPRFGISESPLVVDGKVIVTPGGSQTSLVAFDAKTGKMIWESESLREGAQYVNPVYVEHGGKKMVVTLLTNYVLGVSLADGKTIFKVNYASLQSGIGRVNHTITPLYKDGYLFVTSGYDHDGVKFRLSPDGTSAEVVWQNSDIDPHHGGFVLLGNTLFSSNYQSNSMGKWVAVDWTTGKTLWVNDWHNKGSIISADGMIYIFEEKSGHVGLVRPSNDKLDMVSEFRLPTKSEGPFWAHPVIKNGRLFVRHGDYLAVYDIRN